jgi:predicted PolB exonuclease-like 3'-5' exonuclease
MLKRDIPERVWFFDMEWVPDAAAARRLFADLPADATEKDAIEMLWSRYGATEAKPRPFLKYLFSRVVSISFLSRLVVYKDGEPTVTFRLQSLPKLPAGAADLDEATIINEFLTLIGERHPQLVGFNSYESDVQVLIQRGLVNELTAPMFCKRPEKKWDGGDYFGKWDNEEHLDLIRLFSNGPMTPRLNEIAKICGFPGKMDVDGEQVVDLWLARELDKIVEYNQIDVLNTYLVWLRVVHFCGKLKEEEYVNEQDEFRSFLETEAAKSNNGHIAQFLDKWDI